MAGPRGWPAPAWGEPRVCLVRRLERLARSAERGGRRRRAQEKALVEELLLCVGHLQKELPPEFLPLLEATEKALRQDLDYLRSAASAPLSPEQKGQDQGQGP